MLPGARAQKANVTLTERILPFVVLDVDLPSTRSPLMIRHGDHRTCWPRCPVLDALACRFAQLGLARATHRLEAPVRQRRLWRNRDALAVLIDVQVMKQVGPFPRAR
jgi:hypothetical protein